MLGPVSEPIGIGFPSTNQASKVFPWGGIKGVDAVIVV